MSVVINVRSIDGEERENLSFCDKKCNFYVTSNGFTVVFYNHNFSNIN